jgi:DHA2 family multidrug resistance protein
MVTQQAYVMSFADVFMLLTVLFAGLGVFSLLMQKPGAAAASASGH